MNILFFSIGAFVGAPLRFWLDNRFRPKYQFPIGIFIANILGSFLIGLIARNQMTTNEYLILGFCGALTTWSTFVVDLYLGYQNRNFKTILANLVFSLVFGVFAFQFGFSLLTA